MSEQPGQVISLENFRNRRKTKELVTSQVKQVKRAPQPDQVLEFPSEDFFAQIIERNMEASKKLREDRVRKNSQVLKNYNIKK